MSVKRFEEQVRDAMEELKLSPSENVWTGVESELDKRRKRRVALWWIPVAVLLVGSVYFWNQSQSEETNSLAQKEQSQVENTKPEVLQLEKPQQKIGENDMAEDKVAQLEKAQNEKAQNNKVQHDLIQSEENRNDQPHQNGADRGADKNAAGQNESPIQITTRQDHLSPETPDRKAFGLTTASKNSYQQSITKKSYQKPTLEDSEKSIQSNSERTNLSDAEKSNLSDAENRSGIGVSRVENGEDNFAEPSSIKFTPQNAGTIGDIRATRQYFLNNKGLAAISSSKKSSAVPAKPLIRNWSYGFTASAGIAGIYDRNLIRETEASARSSISFLPTNLSSIVYRTAVVEPGTFYALGGFIERPVGRSFNLTAGLNYSRYNSKVNVGAKISRSTTIFPGTPDNQNVSYYYSPDPKGTYQMHHSMLEIPVTLRYTYKAISVNAGLSGSTLVSANMLAFDARTGVYYREKEKLNRFQFGLTGGFDVALLRKAKHPLHIGPVFRYQISDITSRYSDSRHLLSAALQARFYLHR